MVDARVITAEEGLLSEEAEEEAVESKDFLSSLLTPVGFIMLGVAGFVDLGEFLVEFIPYVGQALSVIIDIFALIFIGGWMLLKSGEATATKKTTATIGKAAKWAKRLKWLRPVLIIVEMIPFVGSAPCWLIAVYLELKHNS